MIYQKRLIDNVELLRGIAVENYYYHCVFKVEVSDLIRQRKLNDPKYKELFESEEFETFTLDSCIKEAGLPNSFQVVVTTDTLFKAVVGMREICERMLDATDAHLRMLGVVFDDGDDEKEENERKKWSLKMDF